MADRCPLTMKAAWQASIVLPSEAVSLALSAEYVPAHRAESIRIMLGHVDRTRNLLLAALAAAEAKMPAEQEAAE